jgi:hypothetical protein
MRYYKRLPIAQLAGLAAHLVVVAGALSSALVSGLEIVFCNESGFRRLTDQENREWESKATGWDKEVGELILGTEPSGGIIGA